VSAYAFGTYGKTSYICYKSYKKHSQIEYLKEESGDTFMFDVIIIGGGPAGLTACLYALRFRLKVLILDKMQIGGYLNYIDTLENYPGFSDGISGAKLTEQITGQLKHYNFQFLQTQVEGITENSKGQWEIKTAKEKFITKAVIISVGTVPSKLGIPGEEQFLGKGVSYCAMCDAPFFKDKEIIVIGGGNTALEEALYLSKFASKVTIVHRRMIFRGDAIFVEKAKQNGKIDFIMDSVCTQIYGSEAVEGVKIKDSTGDIRQLSASGVFLFVGMNPQTEFLKGLVDMDKSGYIIADENLAATAKGIFVAGDCRKNSLRQVISACGEGAKAAYSAHKLMEKYD